MPGPPPDPDEPPLDPRLDELLQEAREAEIPDTPGLTDRVVRTARWQRGVRQALLQLSALGATLADGAVTLLGMRRRKGDT